jgi:hypothetical protein
MKIKIIIMALFVLSSCATQPKNESVSIESKFETAFANANGTSGERQEIIDLALEHPEYSSSIIYFFAARNSFEKGKIEDAGFFFYAAQARARVELFQNPQSPGGGGVALAALRAPIGEYVNPAILEPNIYRKITTRLEQWAVMPAKDFVSPLQSASPKSYEETKEESISIKKRMLEYMRPMAELLENNEYNAAVKEIQRYNLGIKYDERELPENKKRYENAKSKIIQIENNLGYSVMKSSLGG